MPLLVAGVHLVLLEVLEAAVGVVVVKGRPVLVVNLVALEPLLEPHRAHNVVVGHRVERVESVLDALLGPEGDLEGVRGAGAGLSGVVADLDVLEAPGLQDAAVGVVGLGRAVLFVLLVEEEDLRLGSSTLL